MQAGLRRNDGRDASLSRAAMGILGRLFLAPLYHGSAELTEDRTAKLAERPASMQACP